MTHTPAACPPAASTARHAARAFVAAAVAATAALVAGCAAPAVDPGPQGLTDVIQRPAERALLDALRAYDEGQYPQAEAQARRALDAGLSSPRDRAAAHKLLAFVACTSERPAECEREFRAARTADPAFALDRSEAGHPQWGPVYRRALAP
jgi:hypothetical protein